MTSSPRLKELQIQISRLEHEIKHSSMERDRSAPGHQAYKIAEGKIQDLCQELTGVQNKLEELQNKHESFSVNQKTTVNASAVTSKAQDRGLGVGKLDSDTTDHHLRNEEQSERVQIFRLEGKSRSLTVDDAALDDFKEDQEPHQR